MSEENPLNPILTLTHSISDTGVYTYLLTTQVPSLCIDSHTKEVISDPDLVNEIALLTDYTLVPDEVYMAVTYSEISCVNPSAVSKNEMEITINPGGKKGSIIVLIFPKDHRRIGLISPQASGKAIIQFQK